MKRLILGLSIALATVAGLYWSSDLQATPGDLTLSASFVGCSGTQATWDLIATNGNGGTFTWSQSANPSSGSTDDPNYASTSFIKIGQLVWVRSNYGGTSEMVSTNLWNPCLEFP